MQQIEQIEPQVETRSAYHWPEYWMEAAALATFMLSACMFAVLLEHPSSRVHQAIESNLLRRALMGMAMGLTAIAIIRSPWGRRSACVGLAPGFFTTRRSITTSRGGGV